MAKNDFLEGIRKGMLAFLQTRQMMQEYQGNQLQQETYKMQQEQLKQQKQNYMTPEQKAQFDLEQALKTREAEYGQKRKWEGEERESDLQHEIKRLRAKYDVDKEYGVGAFAPSKTTGKGEGERASKPMTINEVAKARDMAKDLISSMVKIGKDSDSISPETQPYYTRVLGYLMGGPNGYAKAVGFLRYQVLYDTGQYPELDDPGLAQPLEIQGQDGKMIQIDPHAYIEAIATEPGATDADIKGAIDFVINYYGQRGMLQNPTKRFIMGPPQQTSEKLMNRFGGAQNIQWRR